MWKLVHLYEVGLPITVAKYICKKYSSHRTIPAALVDNIDNIKVLQECKTTKTAVFEALRVMEVKARLQWYRELPLYAYINPQDIFAILLLLLLSLSDYIIIIIP